MFIGNIINTSLILTENVVLRAKYIYFINNTHTDIGDFSFFYITKAYLSQNILDEISISYDDNSSIIKLNKTHTLVHLHPHNGCGYFKLLDVIVPHLMECTYIRKELNDEPVPSSIDQKNSPHVEEEYQLKGFPYNTL